MALGFGSRLVLVTVVTAAVLTAGLIACSTFGEGNDAPDAGMQPDGGATDAGGGSRPPCRPGLLFCEDFKRTLSNWILMPDSGSVEIVTDPRGSGNVLKAQIGAGVTEPQAFLHHDVSPPWGTDIYVRLFVYLEKLLADDSTFPFLVLAPVELDLVGNKLRLNQFEAPNFGRSATEELPLASWACVEWHLTPTGSTVWMNGREVIRAADTPFESDPATIVLGLNYNAKTSTPATLYFDDLAVAKSPIGCK